MAAGALACAVMSLGLAAPSASRLAQIQALEPTDTQMVQPRVGRVPHDVARRVHEMTGVRLRISASSAETDTCADITLKVPLPSLTPSGAAHKPAIFSHFHKSGGTTMCQLAQQNGERVTPHGNCNLKNDSNWNAQPHEMLTCAERLKLTDANNLTFQGVERWMDDAFCDASYNYVTLMRDPLDRMISNAEYHKTNAELALRWSRPGVSYFDPMDGTGYIEDSTASYDNFYVRMLAGSDAFFLPAGAINRTHLALAKERIARFSAVLILDESFEANAEAQLGSVLGWSQFAVNCSSKSNFQETWEYGNMCSGLDEPLTDDADKEAEEAALPFSDEQLDLLRERNALDYELFCTAQKVARVRTAQYSTAAAGLSKHREATEATATPRTPTEAAAAAARAAAPTTAMPATPATPKRDAVPPVLKSDKHKVQEDWQDMKSDAEKLQEAWREGWRQGWRMGWQSSEQADSALELFRRDHPMQK